MFGQQRHLIENAGTRLLDLPVERAGIGLLVLNGLRRVCELGEMLDSCVSDDMPFAKHFFNELTSLPQEDGSHWMSLLEDLALIFRAKRLAFPELPESAEERQVLDFFESSGEWADRKTLVETWYWEKLPELLSK